MSLSSLHHFFPGPIEWGSIGVLIFAAAFAVVGVFRVVEFKGVGFTPAKFRILVSTHVLGCLLFSAAMVVAGLDSAQTHKILMDVLFFTGLGCLFPGQICVAFRRRSSAKPSG